MKRMTKTVLGLAALAAVLALGVFSAGSASAHQFVTTGPLPALVLVLQDNPQLFHPEAGNPLQVTCRQFVGHGKGPSGTMTATEQIITGTYSKCEATGGFAVTVEPVEYLITAEGTVTILKSIVLKVGGAANCSLKVGGPPSNSNLGSLLYLNNAQDLLVHVAVEGLHSTSSGGECGAAGVEKTTGTYTGLLLTWVDGGTIQWE